MEKRGLLFTAIIAIFFIFVFYYFFIGKSCDDVTCFDEAARQCRPATYEKSNNGNVFKYEIEYALGNNCYLDITVEEVGRNTPAEIARLFEEKSMRCSIPKRQLSSEFLALNSALDYCHGTLKEAMYELMLQRMYDLTVKQMGDVVLEIEETLRGNNEQNS